MGMWCTHATNTLQNMRPMKSILRVTLCWTVSLCLPAGRVPASPTAGRCSTPNSTPDVTPAGAAGGTTRLQAARLAAALASIADAEETQQADCAFAYNAAAAAGPCGDGAAAVGDGANAAAAAGANVALGGEAQHSCPVGGLKGQTLCHQGP
jgi:hypothetical protein